MENWLDKYDVGGPVIKTDATRVAAPTVRFTKKQLEESKAKAKQVTEITNKANAKKLAERKKAVAESSDASIVNPNGKRFSIGDKFRLFPNDVSGVGEVFDNFINPAVVVGNTASALGNAMIDRDPKALAIEAGMALGAGALGFDPLGGAMKLPGKLDKAIYPTRTYRSVVPGGNKLSYESSELADKVFSKGDWTTSDLEEAYEYLRGLEVEGGRRGLLTGNDMSFTEYKVPFWKKNVASDPDVIALKKLQGDVPNPNEYIIPNNKFLYPRRTNLIKAVPENVKEATYVTPLGDLRPLYNPNTIPVAPSSSQYMSPAYKYVEDQLNAVTGQQMPRTFTLDQLRADAIPMENWQQPQFAPNEGMGSFSPFENGGKVQENYNDYSLSAPEGFVGSGTFDEGRDYSPAWGGQFEDGGPVKKFLQPTQTFQNIGYNPRENGISTEYSTTVGKDGEYYLVPGFKQGRLVEDPEGLFNFTGEHLGGPFKTIQSAEDFANFRHKYVEQNKNIPLLFKTRDYAMGGSMPGAVGFTYARTNDPAPSNGKYAKKTMASAENGIEMKYYQEGLDWKPRSMEEGGKLQLTKLDQLTNFTNYNTKQPGGWLDKYK